ncbi:Multidrug resistance protein B [Granulibacter bethesdensis CGDNIH1]|uniref:Multidrug resistance protein B n=2 Tax=Granulibacter bethesdensis TaxID=364410 RepID=Q0BQ77_GRABC|nr:Multidrug resistance protein B [Granulibacter bethesdensis CGDNIH1]APH52897.1 Multidrug resistance protein B [Granulibacter bethesdensis]APH65585.1 Multidrug resistance protein B [Granulibacter bethesdensis]
MSANVRCWSAVPRVRMTEDSARNGARNGARNDAGSGDRVVTTSSRVTAMIVACALFMQNVDGTVIATALPAMARQFGVPVVHMSMALTAYLLSLAVFIPASGWVADRFGARNVFRAAIGIFTLGSVLCGYSTTLGMLVASRVLQGLGGAMMVPVGRLVLLRTVPKQQLVNAMAWVTIPALVGPVVGPPLGGLIVQYASWPWVFDINIPVGLLGILMVTLHVPDVRAPDPGPFDARGLILSGGAVALLMASMETVGRGVVPPWVTLLLAMAGLLCAVVYLCHARGRQRPVLDPGLLRLPTFRVSVISGTLFRISAGAFPFLLPLMLQVGFEMTPLKSGAITLASAVGALAMKAVAARALRQWGFRDTLFWNGIGSAVLVALVAALRPSWPLVLVYGLLVPAGFLRSLQFTAYNALAYAEVGPGRMSAATSLYSTIQQLSLTIGVSAGAGALEMAMAIHGRTQPGLADFSVAFLLIGAIALLAAPTALGMARTAGAEMSGAGKR